MMVLPSRSLSPSPCGTLLNRTVALISTSPPEASDGFARNVAASVWSRNLTSIPRNPPILGFLIVRIT